MTFSETLMDEIRETARMEQHNEQRRAHEKRSDYDVLVCNSAEGRSDE